MNRKGFSLTELVSGMAILCILGGVAIPTFEGWKAEAQLRDSVSDLVCELYRARGSAIKDNSYVVFTFDTTGYQAFSDDGAGGGKTGDWVQQSGERTIGQIVLPESIHIVMAESTFTASRTRFSGGIGVKAGSIVMESSNGSKSKIVLSSIGRIRTEKL